MIFSRVDKCHIHGKSYNKNDIKERGHCYVTGKYKCSAHQIFNASFRFRKKMLVIFYNLRGYDFNNKMQIIYQVWSKHKCYIKWYGKTHGFYIRERIDFYQQHAVIQ